MRGVGHQECASSHGTRGRDGDRNADGVRVQGGEGRGDRAATLLDDTQDDITVDTAIC